MNFPSPRFSLFFRFRTWLMLICICSLTTLPVHAESYWEILNPRPAAGDIVSVDFADNQTGFLITDGGLVFKSENAGIHWTGFRIPDSNVDLLDIDFTNNGCGWVLGGSLSDVPWVQKIYYTDDGCDHWNYYEVGSDEIPVGLKSIFMLDLSTGWACGGTTVDGNSQPCVFRLSGEEQWDGIILPNGIGVELNEIFFINRSFGWVAGTHGYIAFTANGGRSWEAADRATELDLFSIFFISPLNGLATGGNFNNGVILSTSDGGESWTPVENHPATSKVVSVISVDNQRFTAIASGWNHLPAQVLLSNDRQNWSEAVSERNVVYHSMAFADNSVFVGGNEGYLAELDNQQNWSALSQNLLPGTVWDMSFNDSDNGWACGSNGRLLRTNNGGTTWNSIETGTQFHMYSIFFQDASNGWMTGQNSQEYKSGDGGLNWEEVDIGEGDVNFLEFSGNSGYATHHLSVSVSHDGGDNWTSAEVIRGQNVAASALSVPTPDVAWVASAGDSLRRTIDGGESWQAVAAPFSTCYSVSFINPEYGWAVAPNPMGGGIRLYMTENGGDSWGSIHSFDLSPGGVHFFDEDNGWFWENPGKIYRTDNGGRTWRDMEIGVNRVLRNVFVENPERLWLCGDGGLIARWGEGWTGVKAHSPISPADYIVSSLYPNPTNGALHLSVHIKTPGLYSYELLDLNGRLLSTSTINSTTSGDHLLNIDMKDYASGTYLFRINDSVRYQTLKVSLVR